ncbi:MAG: hypothetical protein QNJ36_09310 [Calothrix sp. MO_167.B42]|nr:hypothetical protein [Calothrix sp. MO_167.B42]
MQEKEQIQAIYWLKIKKIKTVKEIAIMLGHNCVKVQKYRSDGLNLLLEPNR